MPLEKPAALSLCEGVKMGKGKSRATRKACGFPRSAGMRPIKNSSHQPIFVRARYGPRLLFFARLILVREVVEVALN